MQLKDMSRYNRYFAGFDFYYLNMLPPSQVNSMRFDNPGCRLNHKHLETLLYF